LRRQAAVDEIVLRALDAFEPELIVVACGLDASIADPLARLMCTSETHRPMTHKIKETALAHCTGRAVSCHEGGYSPTYAPCCGLAILEELAGERTEAEDPMLGW
jgi:acetoin utilization deacetylase AcuC-like enzyme